MPIQVCCPTCKTVECLPDYTWGEIADCLECEQTFLVDESTRPAQQTPVNQAILWILVYVVLAIELWVASVVYQNRCGASAPNDYLPAEVLSVF